MQAIDKLIRALREAPDGRPWVRGLRARVLAYGIPTTVDDGGRRVRHQLVIRYAATPAEGPGGSLVAELVTTEGAASKSRLLATEAGVVRDQPSSDGRAMKVRAVRIDDETWSKCKAEGDASTVVRAALAEYFARRSR